MLTRRATFVIVAAFVATAVAAIAAASSATPAMTGYGATKRVWREYHGRDRSYYVVEYQSHRVIAYEHTVRPRQDQSTEIILLRGDLPKGARLIQHRRRRTCEQLLFKSRRLKKVLGFSRFSIEFSAYGTGGTYRGVVGDIIALPLPNLNDAC